MNDGTPFTSAIELNGVSKVFDGNAVLRNVDFELAAGEFVAIIGPSGSGKSTLLNIMGLLALPSEGTVKVFGEAVDRLPSSLLDSLRSQQIGFAFQASHLDETRSVLRNTALPLQIARADPKGSVDAALESLTWVGMGDKWDEPACNLSGGEKQRVALARAVVHQPRILLADEPTGNLDSSNTAQVVRLLQQFAARGVAVVIVTHDPRVADLADRVIRVEDGALVDERPSRLSMGRRNHTQVPLKRELAPARWMARAAGDIAEAINSLTSPLGKSAVIAMAFALGVSGLVLARGLSESAARMVDSSIVNSSSSVLYGRPEVSDRGLWDASRAESVAHIVGAVKELPGVSAVGVQGAIPSEATRISKLGSKGQELFTGQVHVGSSSLLNARDAALTTNSRPDLLDNPSVSSAFVGVEAAKGLGLSLELDQELLLNGRPIAIAGFVVSAADDSLPSSILLSRSSILTAIVPTFIIKVEPGYSLPLSTSIPLAVDPANPSSFRIDAVGNVDGLRATVADRLSSFISMISSLVLGLACLSGGLTIYLSILSRLPGIALKRAMGASRAGIVRAFLLEGSIVGLAGGLAGLAMGPCLLILICSAQGWVPSLDVLTLLIGLSSGIAAGLLSAAVPAYLASRADPAELIRA
ncbi:ABC transporter ATP-binding protein/permease [Sinomonas terrae]|uniref:ABC transporter ATP-binding protein/permease n=1 Tax=Sinomonas terrae TaxID=2908838 RepID=A0ABS9TXE0_9MICC|nr:ABC transporter ATP-binding protein/permease [Sinomonas terrae]MCH6469043.1 ABC transporter ATP-binding protein/permease [Sinomonas terrae]